MIDKIYIGWDSREDIAYQVCRNSILNKSSLPVSIHPLKLHELREQNIIWRGNDPQASTEFTFTRFLVPYLNNYQGWAIFCDCDFLFLDDVASLFALKDESKAVMCVHHDYTPNETSKMDGQLQSLYPKKNWSSLILYNCAHPSNRILDLEFVNTRQMSYMHQFKWLNDNEIGELPYQWNYLEGWYNTNDAKAVHYTRGGPWFYNWRDVDYAKEWLNEQQKYEETL